MRAVIDADQLFGILLGFILLVMVGLLLGTHESTGNVVLEGIEINENIGDEYGSLTAQQWEGLRGGEVVTQEGRTAYSQYVVFKDPAASDPIESCAVRFERDESGAVGDALHCKKGDDLFEYQLIFDEGLESGIKDGHLEDIEDARIMMLGQEFIITQAKIDGNTIRLRLSGLPAKKLMAEGERHTVVHNDKTYTVTVITISDTTPPKVVLQVDGQVSSALDEKKAVLIKGEFPIIVHEIIPNEGSEADGKDMVNLVFGARSLDIRDTDYTDDVFTRSEVRVDGRRIVDSKLKIKAVRSGDFFTISSFTYRLQAAGQKGDDVFVPAGEGLIESLNNPYGLLSAAWDLRYGGLGDRGLAAPRRQAGGASIIKFDARGDGYDLEFTNNNGISYDIPLLTQRGSTLAYGDDDNDLHFREGTNASDYTIGEKEYFIVTKGSDGRGSTHVLQFDGTADGKAVFTDLSGRNKIIALFPTGAFFLFDWLLGYKRIVVPIDGITSHQVAKMVGASDDTIIASEGEIPAEPSSESQEYAEASGIIETGEEGTPQDGTDAAGEPPDMDKEEDVAQEEGGEKLQESPADAVPASEVDATLLSPLQVCKRECDANIEADLASCLDEAMGTGDKLTCHAKGADARVACYRRCAQDEEAVFVPALPAEPETPEIIPAHPKAQTFDAELTTDFAAHSPEELSRIADVKVGKEGAAQIRFHGEIDVRGLDLDSLIAISHNTVTVNADQAPQLDVSAIVTLENIDMQEPVIYKDGKPCETCTIIEYDRAAKRLTFTTTGFSTFTAIDAAGLGRGTLTLSGSSYEFFVNAAGDAIVVDLDGDGDLDGSAVDIHTLGYGILEPGTAGATTDIVLRTPARYLANKTADETATIRISITDSRAGITLPGLDLHDAGAWEEALSTYGTHFALEDKSRGNDLIIDYPPAGQRSAGVSVVMQE